jgi:[glutamine synthetase] adenylyltransferase / [glutamine synthetase]-adenylyl-L-tyrosine phosphorylase
VVRQFSGCGQSRPTSTCFKARQSDTTMSDDTWQERFMQEYGPAEAAAAVLSHVRRYQEKNTDEIGVLSRVPTDLRAFLAACVEPEHVLIRWQHDATSLDLLLRLGAISRYGFHVACRYPATFFSVVDEQHYRQVWGQQLLAKSLLAEQSPGDTSQRRGVLAQFKHRHFLRLILGDMCNALPFEALVRELSDVVDVLIQSAFALAEHAVLPRFPEVAALSAEQRAFSVIAMGKHGARELNYSSDIDLIFVYRQLDEQMTDGPADHHDYFQRLGQDMIKILENPADEGRLFRIDMRLRPEGDRGELALSLRETLDYYYSVGRPWERQAMIKARPIAGNLALGQKLLDELRPWIYPKEPDWTSLDEARTMRRRIEERAEEANVKTGAGGIRDIEFLAQYFQLAYGGRLLELRDRATLPTLRTLSDRGILPKKDAWALESNYVWLRTVEHRMQMWDDRQEHALPSQPEQRRHVAQRCDFRGADNLLQFERKHKQVREQVRSIVAKHFLTTTQEDDALMALVVQGEADDRLALKFLQKTGLKDHKKANNLLRQLAEEPFFVLSRSRTERSLIKILPLILHLISQAPNPDRTLENFVRIVQAVGGRSTFYQLLGVRADILTLLIEIAAWSEFVVRLLNDFPGLPDEVIDTLNKKERSHAMLMNEARSLIAGLSQVGDPLAFLVARETVSTAILDLEGMSQERVGKQLSATAHAVFQAIVPRIIAERAHEWGIPVENNRPTRFAILSLGKLASGELTYASDMDIIFVSDAGGQCPKANYDGDTFWLRIAQNLMRIMHESRIYVIDPRLRPWGEGGPLVANKEALTHYWHEKRDIWERLAMLRVNYLAGDPHLADDAIALIRQAAFTQPLHEQARQDVRAMRQRLEESVAGRDHLKRGWGGYVDHEFIAQFLCLGLSPEQLPVGSDTETMLIRLGELDRIPVSAVEQLIHSLRTLRFIESRMRLAAGKAISSLPTEKEERTLLAKRAGYDQLADFDLALHLARETGRKWFDRLI